jgi:phospholipid/cholesterol/gamma-HCH transport system ATP-binding protein
MAPAAPQAADARPMIQVVDLHKTFGENKVLTGINLTIPEGSTCVILGGSGSGKTVLMKHMIGLLKPDTGKVIVDGEDIVPLGDAEIERVRRKFGMVFQAAALFDSMNVYENVAFPLREHRRKMPEEQVREVVRKKLALMGLNNVEQKFPADLSGGMRKRVGLARAIATDPEVILWDEPTTGLDPLTTETIDTMIKSMKEQLGCTSIVVTHDMSSAFDVSDRIAMLARHRILAVGTPEQMRASTIPEVRAFLNARPPVQLPEER